MSIVIAIKDKDRIVLGADKQLSVGGNKSHTCTKIWEVRGLPGALMAGVGSARANQIIQYTDIIDKNYLSPSLDTEFIVNNLAPSILATLRANGISCKAGTGEGEDISAMMPNSFIFAYQDKAFLVWHDLTVAEIEDYYAIGSGADVATGALYATKGDEPFSRIVTSIDAAAETTLFVDDGIDILATVFYKQDKKPLYDALGLTDDQVPPPEEEEGEEEQPKKKKSKKPEAKEKKEKKVLLG